MSGSARALRCLIERLRAGTNVAMPGCMHHLAFLIVLTATGCILDEEEVPHISELSCPATLDRSQQPIVVQCGLKIEDDGGSIGVEAWSAGGKLMLKNFSENGSQGRVTFSFELATVPAPGTLTLHVTVLGFSDGNDSNTLTMNITVQ